MAREKSELVSGMPGPASKHRSAFPTVAASYGLLLIVTLLKPFSNLFLAWGMRQFPETLALHPMLYVRAMLDPFVALGIVIQILWLLSRLSLLSVADLSFVLPVTSVGYVITTFLGKIVLKEPVSVSRWVGAVLISLGAALVLSTPEKSTKSGGASL